MHTGKNRYVSNTKYTRRRIGVKHAAQIICKTNCSSAFDYGIIGLYKERWKGKQRYGLSEKHAGYGAKDRQIE